MQNGNEITGLTSLLNCLNDKELNQLLGTVTQNMIQLENANKQEMINAIIQHSPSTSSILHRKLITCSILYKYLHENSVSVFPPVTKSNLIELVTAYWKNKDQEEKINSISSQQQNSNEIAKTSNTLDTSQDALNFPINIMARTFAEWFYKMFNEERGLTSNHFWPDCSLRLHFRSGEDIQMQEILNNSENVVNLLEEVKNANRLFFNPNITHEGVQGRMDSYGLTLIVACGTLHSENLCVGIFQQMFALARDPQASNNWKIKNIELKLNNRNVSSTPSLCESDYTENVLALPEYNEGV